MKKMIAKCTQQKTNLTFLPKAKRLLSYTKYKIQNTQYKVAAISISLIFVAAVFGTTSFFLLTGGSQAASGDVILFWEGDAIPAGWECLSCSVAGTFFEVFPRGSSTYAAASSSMNTATHTATFVSHSAGATAGNSAGAGIALNSTAVSHPVSGIAVGSADIKPPFKNLRFIKANNPAQLPNGIIGIFDVSSSSLPVNWAHYSDMANNYLRGENTTTTGGAVEHTHGITATADAATADVARQGGGTQVGAANGDHTHSISGFSVAASNTPPFITVVFAKLTSTSSLPNGLIAMFDATLPANWISVSGPGQDFNGRFLRGSDAYGATGGLDSHTHATSTITSGGPSTTNTTRSGANTNPVTDTHIHNFDFTVDSGSSLPMYRDVVFAKLDLTATFTQRNYRWYQNIDNVQPGAGLNVENASVADIAQNQAIRLRINIEIGTTDLTTSSQSFLLRFSERGGFAACADVPDGNYANVGGVASTTIWRGFNNTSTADAAQISSVLLTGSTAGETYEEENPTASNTVAIVVGGRGEWDWTLQNNDAKSGATYCFKMVETDGTVLSGYTNIPELIVVKPFTQIRYRWRNDDGGE